MNQVQCPNCGGYKVQNSEIAIDPQTGKEPGWGGNIWLYIFGAPMAIFLLLLGLKSFEVAKGEQALFLGIGGIVAFLGWTCGFITSIRIRSRLKYFYRRTCNICGNMWEWIPGEPEPPIHNDPKLIQLGTKRLEEDQERRRRWD